MIHAIQLVIGLLLAFAIIPLAIGRLAVLTYNLLTRHDRAP